MKYALTYLAGAVTVTGFVLATGGNTATAFWLGFLLAVACSVLVVYGFRRRLAVKRGPRQLNPLQGLSSGPVTITAAVKQSRPVKKQAPMSAQSLAEIEAVSALVNFGASKADAQTAVTAAYRPGIGFDALFRTASAGLHAPQRRAA